MQVYLVIPMNILELCLMTQCVGCVNVPFPNRMIDVTCTWGVVLYTPSPRW
jgi:hypothetical protein